MDLTKEQLDDLWERAVRDDAGKTILPSEMRQLISMAKEQVKDKDNQVILGIGSPFSGGLTCYGPFEDADAAIEVAEREWGRSAESWWVVPLLGKP